MGIKFFFSFSYCINVLILEIVGYDVFIIKLPFDLHVESDFIVFLG